MKKINPIWYLVIGIAVLIIPTGIYLGFLIPAMKDEYIILMASGGAVGGAGMAGASAIPDKTRTGVLFKTASKSFTLLVVVTLVQEFMYQLIGLAAVMIISYLIFMIMRGLYKDGKQYRQAVRVAEEVARAPAKATK